MKHVLVLAGTVCACSLFAVDGTFWGKSDNGELNWSSKGYWFNHQIAGEGGVAWFTYSQLDRLNQNVPGLELTGLYFEGRWMRVIGNPITFTGDYSWITRSAYATGAHTPGIDVTFSGVGTNTLTVADDGWLFVGQPFENFARVRSSHMDLRAWNTSGDCFATCDFQLNGGCANVCPTNAAGETASVYIASRPGTKFVYGPDMGRLRVSKGNGAGTTLTIGAISRFAGGGALALESGSGLDALGGDEKILVSGDAPAVTHGICDASIVGRGDSSDFYRLHYLTYDAADGFKKSAVTPVAFDAATASDVALVSSDATVSGTKAVHALYVEGQPTISFAKGAVLQVGDGTHPAGIIFNPSSMSRIQPTLSGNEGTIAFGGAQGTIYFNNVLNQPTLTIPQKITGTGGLVLVGAPASAEKNWITLSSDAAWSGGTVIASASVCVPRSSCLPESGDVYVQGGHNGQLGSCLRITDSMTFGENQRFHFGGWGCNYNNGAAMHTGGYQISVVFNGPVELSGPGGFVADNSIYKHVFNGVVSGGGWWNFGQATYAFTAPMTYAGRFCLLHNTTVLSFRGAGRPSDKMDFYFTNPAATLEFRDLDAAYVCRNTMRNGGNVAVYGSDVTLDGEQPIGTLTVGPGARVWLGANVSVGRVIFEGGEVYALDGADGQVVRIGENSSSDQLLNGATQIDAALGVVKQGSNTVTIARDSNVAKSLLIADGTVKLDNTIFYTKGVSYWLDASRRDTVTTNAAGCVTKWISANGNGVTFSATPFAPGYTNTYNGLPTMTFTKNTTDYCCFRSDRDLTQRTVYACLAPFLVEGTSLHLSTWGWTGKGQTEYGIRYETYTDGWGFLSYATDYRMNGLKKSQFKPVGETQVLGVFRDSDESVTFPVTVGGYETWSAGNNYNGDIHELVAFERVLSLEERQEVENYMAAKWGLTNLVWHADMPTHQALKPTVALSLAAGAVLDLNGVDQTVASLTGEGTITNSAAKPAVLTVTGTCAFNGKVAGGATVRTSGGNLNVAVSDAGIEAAAGTTEIGVYTEMPPTNGILYWLDAAWCGEGRITWQDEAAKTVASVPSRAGKVSTFSAAYGYPTFVPDAIGGNKPAFLFTGPQGSSQALKADCAVGARTVVLVMQMPQEATAWNYFFGIYNMDRGFRTNSELGMDGGYTLRDFDWAFSGTGDWRWYNGEKKQIAYNQADVYFTKGQPCRFILTRAEWHQDTVYDNAVHAIGSYENRNCCMLFAEAMAYDHVLSDDEVQHLEGYLKAKWFGEALPAARTDVFGADTTLRVTGGATADLGGVAADVAVLSTDATGGAIAGDVSFARFDYDVADATSVLPLVVQGKAEAKAGATAEFTGYGSLPKSKWPVLTAETSVGELSTGKIPRFEFIKKNEGWYLNGFYGTLLFLR